MKRLLALSLIVICGGAAAAFGSDEETAPTGIVLTTAPRPAVGARFTTAVDIHMQELEADDSTPQQSMRTQFNYHEEIKTIGQEGAPTEIVYTVEPMKFTVVTDEEEEEFRQAKPDPEEQQVFHVRIDPDRLALISPEGEIQGRMNTEMLIFAMDFFPAFRTAAFAAEIMKPGDTWTIDPAKIDVLLDAISSEPVDSDYKPPRIRADAAKTNLTGSLVALDADKAVVKINGTLTLYQLWDGERRDEDNAMVELALTLEIHPTTFDFRKLTMDATGWEVDTRAPTPEEGREDGGHVILNWQRQ